MSRSRRITGLRCLAPFVAVFLSVVPAWSQDLVAGAAALASSDLAAEEARFVANLKLVAGPATLRLERGYLIPATAAGAPTGEYAFLGSGRLTVTPPNDLEADQLEVFTEEREFDEPFTTAIIVLGDPAFRGSLAERPVGTLRESELIRARSLFQRWRQSRARQLLGVDSALLRANLGEPGFAEFFATAVTTANDGDVYFLVDPEEAEQVTLGRFVPLDLEAREERKLRRALHRAQRRGRLIGVDLGDLGSWDTWIAGSLVGGPGRTAFEPRHYRLDVTTGLSAELVGTARIELEALVAGRRTVLLRLPEAAQVTAARDGTGASLPFSRHESELLIVLPTAPELGTRVSIEISYAGPLLERAEGKGTARWFLPDSVSWYPHAGQIDRATYEVRVTAPPKLTTVGPGAVPGDAGHFRIDRPTFGFTFEIGRFETHEDHTGKVPITLYVDDHAKLLSTFPEEILDYARNAVDYLIDAFGPLPVEHLTVVTSPRLYSQSFLGHLVLSESMVSVRLRWEDSRTVIAHEVAHQWWGHQADFVSYRDQWLTEAIANYAAMLFHRERLGQRYALGPGPVDGWSAILPLHIQNGRTLESLGPVVLGGRLDSSMAPAYQPIVYWKGALLIDMLDNVFGQGQFLAGLREVLADHRDRPLTTADFLAEVSDHGGVNLDEFARRFVYGVGLPEVYFSYQVAERPDGRWEVTGTARQRAPYRYLFKVATDPRGGLPKVVHELDTRSRISTKTWLPVPVEIGVFDPEAPLRPMKESARRNYLERVEREGNAVTRGRTLLRGEETTLRFETDFEPRRLWLDRWNEVFCNFYDEEHDAKQSAYARGMDHYAAGRFPEAERDLTAALAYPLVVEPPPSNVWERGYVDLEVEYQNRTIRLGLTRVLLALDKVDAAERMLLAANVGSQKSVAAWQRIERRILKAHLALRNGQPEFVRRLVGKTLGSKAIESREAHALLAVAAWALDDANDLAAVRRNAEADGMDLSVLDTPRTR